MSSQSDPKPDKQVGSNDDIVDLKTTLRTMAMEMERFQSCPEEISYSNCHGEPNLIEDICKSSMQFKENQIQQLRSRLKAACDTAKVLEVYKENVPYKSNDNETKKPENSESSNENVRCLGYFDKLTREYTVSAMKLEVIQTIIDLGYSKLQNIYNKKCESNLDIASKLNQIIFACGQFYANYYNKREKCKKLETQNIKLMNKIKQKSEQLTLLRQALHQLRKTKEAMDEEQAIKSSQNKVKSSIKLISAKSESNDIPQKERERIFSNKAAMANFSHLDIIRCLIEEQENMASNLKAITEELDKTCNTY